jgi:hypothetical protein
MRGVTEIFIFFLINSITIPYTVIICYTNCLRCNRFHHQQINLAIMSFSRKKRKELDDDDDDDIPMNDDESDANDEDEKGELSSPSATTAPAGNGNTPTKLKCLKCFRAARKGVFDCLSWR